MPSGHAVDQRRIYGPQEAVNDFRAAGKFIAPVVLFGEHRRIQEHDSAVMV